MTALVYMGPLGSTQRVRGVIAGGQYAVRVVDSDTSMLPGEAIISKLMAPLLVPVNVALPPIDASMLGQSLMITNLSGAGVLEFNIIAPVTFDFSNPGVVIVFRPALAGGPNYLFNYQDSIVFVATVFEVDPPPPFPIPPRFFVWVQQ